MKHLPEKPRQGQLFCLVVDDEPLMVQHLANLINQHPALHLGMATTDPHEALIFERENPVDLAFVDIEMEEMDGLELIKTFSFHTWVVICTAHGELGDESSLAGAAGFMKKPVSPERFEAEVDQICHRMVALIDHGQSTRDYFHINTRKTGEQAIALEQIVFFYSENEKVYLSKLNQEVIEINDTLTEVAEKLEEKGFLRIHRSYVVNMYFRPVYVPKTQPVISFGREVRFKLPGYEPNTLPVGRRYRKNVLNQTRHVAR